MYAFFVCCCSFEDVEAELEGILTTVKEYMKEQKTLAALLLLEAVFIVAVTEPVGPNEYAQCVCFNFKDNLSKLTLFVDTQAILVMNMVMSLCGA